MTRGHSSNQISNLGFGFSLSPNIFSSKTLKQIDKSNVDWFELIVENYLYLDREQEEYVVALSKLKPLALHALSSDIGGLNDLNLDYFKKIKRLAKKLNCPWWSDHLCWKGVNAHSAEGLLPLPKTKEMLKHIIKRVKIIQDLVEIPFLIENITTYYKFPEDEMPEWEFYCELIDKTGSFMLFDVNNVYVNSCNLNFSWRTYLSYLPLDKIVEIHLGGHEEIGHSVLDTHSEDIADEVWEIFRWVYSRAPVKGVLLERDANVRNYEHLVEQLSIARKMGEKCKDIQEG